MLLNKIKAGDFLSTAALILVVVTIPLYNNLNSIALVAFVCINVFRTPLKISLAALKKSTIWIFPFAYFVWIALSWFWDSSGSANIRDIERYAILFFAPPVLAMIPKYSFKQIRAACAAFVMITTILCVICLARSYNEYLSTGDSRVFYYHYLGMQVELNAIFLSCYCLVSIAWLLYYGFVVDRWPGIFNVLALANVLFLFTMIFLLSSKLLVFLTLVTLVFFIFYIGRLRGHLVISLIVTATIIAGGLFATRKLSYLNWRIHSSELKTFSGEGDNNNGIAIRLLMWNTGWEMFKEKPLLGYGISGARDTLVDRYRKQNFTLGYSQGYHAHNQFLESSIMGGIPALILLILMIGSLIINAINERKILLLHLLSIFLIQALIESSFEVQQELVFYIFFIYLFACHRTAKPAKQQTNDDYPVL